MNRNRIDTRRTVRGLTALAFGLFLCLCSMPRYALAAESDTATSTTETLPLLVIVVGFAGDDGHAAMPYDSDYDWHDTIFGSQNSLSSYYLDMSEGAFTFAPVQETCGHDKENANEADRANDGIVHITLDEPHGDWGLVNEDSSIALAFSKVVLDAFHEAGRFVDYSAYDRNDDSAISTDELAVCLCVAGYDASPFENPGRTDVPSVWPHSGQIARDGRMSEGLIHLDSYITIAEHLWHETDPIEQIRQEPIGVLYHELGHYLGLPDLYPTGENGSNQAWSAYGVNELSLMHSGGWAESPNGETGQSTPTALDAWSRYALGWELPEIVTDNGDYLVSSQLSESGYHALLIPSPDPDQYFLVENRQIEGHDAALATLGEPNGGIVIWHVDKSAIRKYAYDNELNCTDHIPGVMPLFFEKNGLPNTKAAFFSAESFRAHVGNGPAVVNLLLYDDLEAGTPSTRIDSGITVECDSPSARDMTVHVEFSSIDAGMAGSSYPINDDDPARTHIGGSALGRIASSAILDETDADVALVDEGAIRSGLPEGLISFEQAEQVLDPRDRIECFDLTGAQIVQLIEQSYLNAALCDAAAFLGLDSSELHATVLNIAGVSYTIASDQNGVAHVTSASIGDERLERDKSYYVATVLASDAARASFEALAPNILVLWGCPADAVRSFVQGDMWESRAASLTSDQEVKHVPRETAQTAPSAQSQPREASVLDRPLMPVILCILAACFIFGGAVFTVAIRRRR